MQTAYLDSFDITWHGVNLTVECEIDDDTALPVRVLLGKVDISDLIDLDDNDLAELVQAAHDTRYSVDTDPDFMRDAL